MKRISSFGFLVIVICYGIFSLSAHAVDQTAKDSSSASNEYRTHFLEMCDLSIGEMSKPLVPFYERYRKNEDPKTHHYPFFMDSFAIRPLCVAYDMTGEKKYIDACTRWADMVVEYQKKMTPEGAYYLNYGKFRQPGEDKGWWFSADSATVASAILAVAIRADDARRRDKYIESVRSFAKLVIDKYLRKSGGFTDGVWSYDGEYWCSTATIGTLLFHLYAETKDPEYLKLALGCVDWMNGRDFHKQELPGFESFNPGVILYCFEMYAASLPYLEEGSPRRVKAEAQIAEALKWLAENHKGRGAKTDWNYLDKGKVHISGSTYVMYLLSNNAKRYRELSTEADRELRYVDDLLFRNGNPRETDLEVWGLMTFGMMSYAERLRPGAMFRAR